MKKKLFALLLGIVFFGAFNKLYAQQLIYDNNFSGTSKDWPDTSTDKYALKSAPKGLTLTHNTINFKPIFSSSTGASFASGYTLEARLGYISGDENGFEGVSFASADHANFYYFGYSSSGSYTLGSFIGGQGKMLINPTASPAIKRGEKFNIIRIVKTGTQLQLYINDVLVNTYTGLEPLGNSFGLLVSGKQTIIYSHLSLKYNSSQPLANNSAGIFYHTEFNSPDKVQWNYAADSVQCETKDGYYHITSQTKQVFSINSNPDVKPDTGKNFSIETTITQIKTGNNTNGYGIIFGTGEVGHYRFLVASSGGYALMYNFRNTGYNTILTPWAQSAVIQPTGKPNHLKIEIYGSLIKLFINNVFVNEYKGYKPAGPCFGFLTSGRQELKVDNLTYAYLKDEPKPVQQTVTAPALPQSRGLDVVVKKSSQINSTGRYFALFIAVEKYNDPNIPQLNGPVAEAQQLADVFKSQYNFNPENITFLPNPNRHLIMASLNTLQKTLGDNDNLVIFYAGHGKVDNNTKEGYIFPVDADKEISDKWVSNSDIRTQLRAFRAKHILFISDACYSGSILTVDRSIEDNAPKDVKIALQNKSRNAITSGNNDEQVPDDSNFIKYLLKALNDNSDQYVTAQTLYSQFRLNVVNNSSMELPQDPKYGVILATNDEQGDFVFSKK